MYKHLVEIKVLHDEIITLPIEVSVLGIVTIARLVLGPWPILNMFFPKTVSPFVKVRYERDEVKANANSPKHINIFDKYISTIMQSFYL